MSKAAATGLPSLGLGTASLALIDEAEASRTLHYALEQGFQYFDAAPLYGGGQAERRLGRCLKETGADVFLSTKVGRYRKFGEAAPGATGVPDIWDYSAERTIESLERSLNELHRDRLDAVYLHDIEADPDRALAEALPVLHDYQRKGTISLVGAGCNTVEVLMAALDNGASDVLLVAGRWTLLDRTAGPRLLPRAQELGTHVVAGGVLNSGILAGVPRKEPKFDYKPASPEIIGEVRKLNNLAERAGVSLMSAALQFPARDARVGTTLLGSSSSQQLASIVQNMKTPIDAEHWRQFDTLGFDQ